MKGREMREGKRTRKKRGWGWVGRGRKRKREMGEMRGKKREQR